MIHKKLIPVLLLLLLLSACARVACAQTRYALMIGCGEHISNAIPRLLAPPNDIRLMSTALTARCGFLPQNITVLGLKPNEAGNGYDYSATQATSNEIYRALQSLAGRTRPDDYVVIYITGHGASIADSNSPTLTRQYLVAYDQGVRDDTLKRWVARVRGHVTLVLDTCFSGGMLKGRETGSFDGIEYDLISKAVPPDVVIPQTLAADKGAPYAPKVLPFTLLAACEYDETTHELQFHRHDGSIEMAISGFTWALYYTLIRKGTLPTITTLRQSVEDRLRSTGLMQHPVFRPAADPLALFAPGAWQPGGVPYPWTRANTGQILLQAGRFAEVRPGMRLRIGVGRQPRWAMVEEGDWFESRLRPVVSLR